MTEIIVLDASVILSFLLGESASIVKEVKNIAQKAKSNKTKVYESPLLLLAVGNALKHKLKPEKAIKTYAHLKKLNIIYQSFTHEDLEEIIKASYQFNTTVYDTSYHYLAKILDGTFITCDRVYFQKSKSWGNIKVV